MKYVVSALLWFTGLTAFLLLIAGGLIISYMPDPRRYEPLLKFLCRMLLRSIMVGVKVSGIENISANSTYLFITNHVNIFDVFVLEGYIPVYVRGVELDEHFDWIFYGPLIRRLGNVPISQSDAKEASKSLLKAKTVLERGTSLVIMPEGHRTLNGNLGEFKKGPFYLAKKSKVSIVPAALVNAFQVKRKGSWVINPGTIELKIGKGIPYPEYKNLKIPELRDEVKKRVEELMSQSD